MRLTNTRNFMLTVSAMALAACGGEGMDAGADLGTSGEALTTGSVQIQVFSDAVSSGALVSSPVAGATVYDGDWQLGRAIGQTDANGRCTVTLPTGTHQIGVMKPTSSTTKFQSNGNTVAVSTTPASLVVHAPLGWVEIQSWVDVGYGYALYVTGETAYLGNWQTAWKMTPVNGGWDLQKNLPIGAQFKIVKAPWVAGDSISTSAAGVVWEWGSNHCITPMSGGNYQAFLTITPRWSYP